MAKVAAIMMNYMNEKLNCNRKVLHATNETRIQAAKSTSWQCHQQLWESGTRPTPRISRWKCEHGGNRFRSQPAAIFDSDRWKDSRMQTISEQVTHLAWSGRVRHVPSVGVCVRLCSRGCQGQTLSSAKEGKDQKSREVGGGRGGGRRKILALKS